MTSPTADSFPEVPGVAGEGTRIEVVAPGDPRAVDALEAFLDDVSYVFEDETAGLPARTRIRTAATELDAPRGRFLIAVDATGATIGTGGIYAAGPRVGEITHLWVHPDHRGRGHGRGLLEELEAVASELGVAAIRLSTNRFMTEATILARACDFREIRAYSKNSLAHHWLQKRILPKPEGDVIGPVGSEG